MRYLLTNKKLHLKNSTFSDVIPQVSEPKEQVKYTNNKSLNDVLNETVGLVKTKLVNIQQWVVEHLTLQE